MCYFFVSIEMRAMPLECNGTDEEIIQQCGGRYSILFTNM